MELPEHLHGGPEISQPVRSFLVRQPQDKTILEQFQAEVLQVACIRNHVAVEIIGKTIQRIDVDMRIDAVAEQAGLIQHPRPLEHLHGIVGADGAFLNRQRLCRHLPHTSLHTLQKRRIQSKVPLCPDKQGVTDGVFDGKPLHIFRTGYVMESLQHQKSHTAFVRLHSRLFFCRDHFQRTIPVQGLVQLTELSIPVDQQNLIGMLPLKINSDLLIRSSKGICTFHPVHDHIQQLLFFHDAASFSYFYFIS